MRFILAALRVMMTLTTFAAVLRGPCLSMAHPGAGQANFPGCSAQNTTEKRRSTLFPATTSARRITSHIPHTFLVAPSGNFCTRTFSCLCSLKVSTNLMENRRRISAQRGSLENVIPRKSNSIGGKLGTIILKLTIKERKSLFWNKKDFSSHKKF